MSIDTSGTWWKGSEAEDLIPYLKGLTADSYPASEFRHAVCECGSVEFVCEFDRDEETCKRICPECSREHFVCDSEKYWEESEPVEWECIECHGKRCNICVGFSMRNTRNVQWVSIGCRCAKCGILGCYVDWNVSSSPSLHLMDMV